MQALSGESRVVTLDDFDAFRSHSAEQTTVPTITQDQSRTVTLEDFEPFMASAYRWQAPSPSVPRETLEQARIPAIAEGEETASKLTRLENVIRPVKRISLEGQGEFLKALGADIINSAIDKKPTLENLHAAWRTDRLPIEEELAQQTGLGATITRGIGGVVGSVPSLIEGGAVGKALGVATAAPRLALSAGYGAAMGSEAYSRSQGDWEQALKSAAVGAAFPVVGRWAAKAGAAVSKLAVESGVPLAQRQTVQKAIEFGIEQAALQSFNHVISIPEYLDLYSQGGADAVKQAILENTIALGVYAIPGIVRTLSPRFPSELARTIAQEASKDLDKAVKSTVEIPDFRKRLADEQQKALEKAAALPAKPPVEPPKESEVPNAVQELGRSIVPETQQAGGVSPLEAQVRPPEARPVAGQAEAGVRPPSVTISPAVPGVQKPSIVEPKPGETAGELYHGSVGKWDTLQAGTMMTDDPAWAAGYTTKTLLSGKDEFVGTVHRAEVQFKKPIIVKTLHDAESELLRLAKATGKKFSTLNEAAKLVNKATGADAIIAVRDGKMTGAIPLGDVPVKSTITPTEAVEMAQKAGRYVPDNILQAYESTKEVTPVETQERQVQVGQRPPVNAPVAPPIAPEPGPPSEPTLRPPTPLAAQEPPKPAIVAPPVAEAPKPPTILNLGISLEHRGGVVPASKQAGLGMRRLSKALAEMGALAGRFTGVRFEKLTGFGLAVASDDPRTLVVDPEQLHKSTKILRVRYGKRGLKAALDEEVFHSFQHEVLNALEKVDPGITERMYSEMGEKSIEDTHRMYGAKLSHAETVLEFLRMKNQRERGVLTERFTRMQGGRIFKESITRTMRGFLDAITNFIDRVFGTGKPGEPERPTQIQSFYDATVKLAEDFDQIAAEAKIVAGAKDVQDWRKAYGSEGERTLDWTPDEKAIVSEAMKDDKFVSWISTIDEKLAKVVQSIANGDERLTQIATDYIRDKKMPDWASRFLRTGKLNVGNVGAYISKAIELPLFQQRLDTIEANKEIGPTEARPEGRQIAAEAPTPDEILARAEEAAPAVGPETPLESLVREFIQRREEKGVLERDDILELKAALEALGLPENEIINAAKRIVTRAASPEELERELKAVPSPEMVAARLLSPSLAKSQEEEILRRTVVSNVVAIDPQAQAEFKALPPGVQSELSGISDAVKSVDIAGLKVAQRTAVPPVEPYTLGQKQPGPLRRWFERITRPITDPQRRSDVINSLQTAATCSLLDRQIENERIQQKLSVAQNDLVVLAKRAARMGNKTAKAQALDDLTMDIRDNYLKVLTDGIAALRDRATLTGAEEAYANEYKRELNILKDEFRTEALRKSIVAAYDSLASQKAIDNPTLSPKDLEKLIVKAKPTEIPSDRLRLVAKMMGEYVGIHQRLATIKNIGLMPSSVFAGAHAKFLKDLQSATSPRAVLSMLNKYANAKGKAKALWDAIKESERDFTAKLKEVENLSLASDYMQRLITSPEFTNRMAELGDLNDVTRNLIKTPNNLGWQAQQIIPNPNPVPEDPVAAANYVKEVVIEPWKELTEAQAEKNLSALLKARDFLIEYLNTGKDPIILRSIEQQLLRMQSMDLNPDFLPKYKRNWRLSPSWTDIHRWFTSMVHTPEYVGYFIPGRPGQMYNAALERWSETRARAASAINDFSAPAERLSDIAAGEHKMNMQEWLDNVANPILSSYSSQGLTPATKGIKLFNGVTVTAADMAAIRSQHLLFTELVRRGLPEGDPLYASEPLRIILNELDARRKAFAATSFMVPRRFLREAIDWAKDWITGAKPTAVDKPSQRWEIRWNQLTSDQQKNLLDFLNDKRRFNLVVLSHLETIYQRPKYVVRSPLESVYREYLLKRLDEPSRFNASTVQELAGKLVSLGASDANGNPLSTADVVTILTGEIDQAMRNLSNDVNARRAADVTPNLVKIESADNFTTLPRANLVAPEGMYDYALATGAQHMAIYSQIQRPYFVRFIQSLQEVTKAFSSERSRMNEEARKMLPQGATERQIGKQAQKYSQAEWKQGKFWMDYNDVSRMADWTDRLLKQVNAFAQDYSSKLNEALMGYNIASRAVTSMLLSQESSAIRNILGSRLIGNWRSMQIGRNEIPYIESAGANQLMDRAMRVPISGDVLRVGARTLKDGVDFVTAMRNFVLRTSAKTPWGQNFLKSVKSNPSAWGQWATDMMNHIDRIRAEYEDDVRLGIVQKSNVWNSIRNSIRFFAEGGNLSTRPQTRTAAVMGGLKSLGNIATNTILGGAIVNATENAGNAYAAREARETVSWLERNIALASGNRSMAGVDLATTHLTPQEIYMSRNVPERNLARLKEQLGPAIRLDYVALRYIKALQESKASGQPIENVHLLTDGEMDYFMTRLANKYNRQTVADRPMALKNPLARFLSQLMGYGFWLTQEYSFARAKLASEVGKFDPSFSVSRMMLYTLIFGAATVPLFDWLAEHLKNKERAIPSLAKASWEDVIPVLFMQSQGFMPTMLQFAAGIPSAFGASRYNVNTGINVVPLQMAQNTFNWMKAMAQTHDPYRPTVKFLAQIFPNTQFLVNNIAGLEFTGTRLVQDAKLGLRTAGQLSNVEMPPMVFGQAPARLTPVSSVIERLVNYMNLPNPDWNIVMQIRDQAISMLSEKGETDPSNTVNRMVLARAPMQSVFGRQLSLSEVQAVQSKMSETALLKTQQTESNFAQYSALTGSAAPAALTMPKPSRKDMPIDGGATYAGGGNGGGSAVGVVGGMGGATLARSSTLLAGPRTRRTRLGRVRRARVSIRRATGMRRPSLRRRMVRVVARRRFRL